MKFFLLFFSLSTLAGVLKTNDSNIAELIVGSDPNIFSLSDAQVDCAHELSKTLEKLEKRNALIISKEHQCLKVDAKSKYQARILIFKY